ncbi:MAG: hypothetical protein MUE49_08805 [Rhodospirillales bacterium]|nr:hypothetical protein [Rhodospirillales bacterium]
MSASVGLGGAHQRLLPETIPLRFFGTSTVAHLLAWIGLVVVADAVPFYQGGPGPVAAAFHLLTVGVLLSSAMGASLQMLPVALGRAAPTTVRCNVVYTLLLVGGIGLVCGFAIHETRLMVLGAAALTAAVAVYAVALSGVLKGASGLGLVRLHVWAALTCLVLGALVAAGLALDYRESFLVNHQVVALIHMLLLAFGFMGLLAFGLSQILIPMFAIAETSAMRAPALAFGLALTALITAVIALLSQQAMLVAVAAVLGLAAAGGHVADMEAVLAKRIRRRLGGEFLLIRLSWGMLALSVMLAGGLVLELLPPAGPALFGFVTLFGWLLSLVIGVQQRILPFLGSMHAVRVRARPLAPTKLVDERCLRFHRWCHAAALGVVAVGIVSAEPLAIRIGAGAGAVGAFAYGVFAVTVLKRTRRHLSSASSAVGRTAA